jgi:hypothetical protein
MQFDGSALGRNNAPILSTHSTGQKAVLPMDKLNAISTRNLSMLPEIEALRRRLQQMSALEAVFASEYGSSGFEFHPNWSRSQQMGAFKNGAGDELFAHFTPDGCFVKGFAHESIMSPYRTNPPVLWPGLFSSVPLAFESSLKEPAFDIPATTFVVWRCACDPSWHTGDIQFPHDEDPDGSHELLSRITMAAQEFADWLAENYEVEVDANIVVDVFNNLPLTDARLRALNPSAATADLRGAVQKTGYAQC